MTDSYCRHRPVIPSYCITKKKKKMDNYSAYTPGELLQRKNICKNWSIVFRYIYIYLHFLKTINIYITLYPSVTAVSWSGEKRLKSINSPPPPRSCTTLSLSTVDENMTWAKTHNVINDESTAAKTMRRWAVGDIRNKSPRGKKLEKKLFKYRNF